MNRRSLLTGLLGIGAGLVLPEPARVRAYSFLPGDSPRLKNAIAIKGWAPPNMDYVYYVIRDGVTPYIDSGVLFVPADPEPIQFTVGK